MAHGLMGCLKKIFNKVNGAESKEPVAKKLNSATRVLQPAHTLRLKPEPEESGSSDPAKIPLTEQMLLAWHGITDTGMVRDHNEDCFSCADLDESVLFVVADGMGGHDAGEVASRIAVEAVCKEVCKGAEKKNKPIELIRRAVLQANRAVASEGEKKGSNMGTTLGVALVAENKAYIANVGDSRVYWIEDGSIKQVTEDHSLVAKLVAAGKLTKDEARRHPKSNLLYRTIGTDQEVKVDTFTVELKKGGSILLCTDGLWGEVRDEDIHGVCVTEKDIQAACAKLVQMANRNGGKDNITAVVVRVM